MMTRNLQDLQSWAKIKREKIEFEQAVRILLIVLGIIILFVVVEGERAQHEALIEILY